MKLPILLCGACCQHMHVPPLNLEEWVRLPNDLKREIEQYQELMGILTDDWQPRIWLTDNNQCKHYEYRPECCRDFQEKSAGCREAQLRVYQGDNDERNLRPWMHEMQTRFGETRQDSLLFREG